MTAKSLLESRFSEKVELEEIASQLNISYVWFRTYFKKHTGFSPYDYLLNIRINHARLLLKNTSRSVKEISQSSGFESQQQFSKTFKKKTGLTPMQFRNQWGKVAILFSLHKMPKSATDLPINSLINNPDSPIFIGTN